MNAVAKWKDGRIYHFMFAEQAELTAYVIEASEVLIVIVPQQYNRYTAELY